MFTMYLMTMGLPYFLLLQNIFALFLDRRHFSRELRLILLYTKYKAKWKRGWIMSQFLVVVDMQNDFITGALGTKEAQEMLPAAILKVKEHKGPILYTMDTHQDNYLETSEGKKLPVKHCIKGSEGWKIAEGIVKEGEENKVFEKGTFGSLLLAEYLREKHETEKIEKITLIGVCTDICVVSNALLIKANLPEVTVEVDSACCAGVTKEKHECALETMRSCQIEVC